VQPLADLRAEGVAGKALTGLTYPSLAAIDGFIFGDSRSAGSVRGRKFSQARLGFAFLALQPTLRLQSIMRLPKKVQ
jgi:predicted Zn-dependent protease